MVLYRYNFVHLPLFDNLNLSIKSFNYSDNIYIPAIPSHRRVALIQRRAFEHKNCPRPHEIGGQLSSTKKKFLFQKKSISLLTNHQHYHHNLIIGIRYIFKNIQKI